MGFFKEAAEALTLIPKAKGVAFLEPGTAAWEDYRRELNAGWQSDAERARRTFHQEQAVAEELARRGLSGDYSVAKEQQADALGRNLNQMNMAAAMNNAVGRAGMFQGASGAVQDLGQGAMARSQETGDARRAWLEAALRQSGYETGLDQWKQQYATEEARARRGQMIDAFNAQQAAAAARNKQISGALGGISSGLGAAGMYANRGVQKTKWDSDDPQSLESGKKGWL